MVLVINFTFHDLFKPKNVCLDRKSKKLKNSKKKNFFKGVSP